MTQENLRSGCDTHTPDFMMSDLGFRLVRTLHEP